MSSKQDLKMLKELSQFTRETYKQLKTKWKALPSKSKPAQRRKTLAIIEERKELQARRKEELKNLPIRL